MLDHGQDMDNGHGRNLEIMIEWSQGALRWLPPRRILVSCPTRWSSVYVFGFCDDHLINHLGEEKLFLELFYSWRFERMYVSRILNQNFEAYIHCITTTVELDADAS